MKIQTLHQCNINQILNFNCFSPLLSKEDAIVFYGHSIDDDLYQTLIKKFSQHDIYFLISHNPDFSNIDYIDWLNLVEKAKNTLTWQ